MTKTVTRYSFNEFGWPVPTENGAYVEYEAVKHLLQDEPPADSNPLDPTNNHFRLCQKGHVGYSVSFDECPSCKIERLRVNRTAEPK